MCFFDLKISWFGDQLFETFFAFFAEDRAAP